MKLIFNFLIFLLFIPASYSSDSFDDLEDEIKVEKRIDPLSGYNRAITSFNDTAYEYVLSPVARTYGDIVHEDIRKGVRNIFHNLKFPIRFVNNILQLKFKNALDETQRFVLNSTIGILGFVDVGQDSFKIYPHNEDFGQTLGYWGVGSGFHIVWPFFGPSNLRDSIGSFGVDAYLNPTSYYEDRSDNLVNNYGDSMGLKIFEQVNNISFTYKQYETMKKDAIDLYPFLRDSYEQYRKKQIEE
jgi:phospholipid-binding lipoprotein MlaA